MGLFDEVSKIGHMSPKITGAGWAEHDEYGFSRVYAFTVRGVKYTVECWANICYLKCGELTVVFDSFNFSGTWPNSFKKNLQFYSNGKTIAILPVEEYQK
jgi:hypothetical protein